MATKWVYLALLVSLTTLGVCFAVDYKDVGVAHRIPVPPSDDIAHFVPPRDEDNIHKDSIQPPPNIPSPPKQSTDGMAHRVSVIEDKMPPSHGMTHWVRPREYVNIHNKDSIRPTPGTPSPPKQSIDGMAHRMSVTEDRIPPSHGMTHWVRPREYVNIHNKDSIRPTPGTPSPPKQSIDGMAHRMSVTEDKIPPSHGMTHWVRPREYVNIHNKDSIRPTPGTPSPPKQRIDGMAHRIPVIKDKIPPLDGTAHWVWPRDDNDIYKDSIRPTPSIPSPPIRPTPSFPSPPKQSTNGMAHRILVTEDKILPLDGTAHWVRPRDDNNIHKDSIRPTPSIPSPPIRPTRNIPSPPKQSTESKYVNDPSPGAGGRVGGGRGGGGERYCNGDDCRIGMQPIYGRHPPSPPPFCQPTNPPPCSPNPPSCTPNPPCSQDCGWGGNGAASPQQPGLSRKGMRQEKGHAFYDHCPVNQLIVAMQELTKVIKKKAAP